MRHAERRLNRRIEEEGLVNKLYNPTVKAWFGDMGDGVHTGCPEDPRMAIIEVQPTEIQHYHQTRTGIGATLDIVTSAITGATSTPGEIRTNTAAELAKVKDA